MEVDEGETKREAFAGLTVFDLPYVRTLRVCAVSMVEQAYYRIAI
jgi:hypothetical protein